MYLDKSQRMKALADEHLVPTELRTFIPDDNFTSPPSSSSAQTEDVWMELLGRKSEAFNLCRHYPGTPRLVEVPAW